MKQASLGIYFLHKRCSTNLVNWGGSDTNAKMEKSFLNQELIGPELLANLNKLLNKKWHKIEFSNNFFVDL